MYHNGVRREKDKLKQYCTEYKKIADTEKPKFKHQRLKPMQVQKREEVLKYIW